MIVFRVERIFITFVLTVPLFVPFQPANAQQCTVDLQVVPLASINLGDLIVAEEIENSTVFATILIGTNTPIQVRLEGVIEVQLPTFSEFREAGRFTTVPFEVAPPQRNVLNTDFPDVIDIENAEGNDDVLDDLRDIGRPAGGFRFTVIVTDVASGVQCSDVHTEFITNPAQILRTAPTDGSQEREENVVFSWTGDAGFDEYLLTVNVREGGQSPEDALGTNQPPIFSGSVEDAGGPKDATSLNLRNLPLQRQVLPGMELVWQVTGVVPGVGGGLQIPTDIGSFFILDPNSALMSTTVSRLIILMQQVGYSDFASQLQGGEITLTGEIELDDGTILSLEELTSLLTYLEINSDNIIGVGIE